MATTYPFSIDTNTSLPPAPTTVDGYVYIDYDLSAIEAIETELGVLPSSSYPNVRTRLDVLESRINNPCVPTGGDYISIGSTPVTIIAGFGDPNLTSVSANPGSLFLREDGTTDQGIYAMRTDGYWYQVMGTGGGGGKSGVTNITSSNSPYQVISTDNVIAANSTSGTITVNLPPSPAAGDEYVIKDSNGQSVLHNITINGGAINIDGSSTLVMNSAYQAVTVIYSGSSWNVL